MLIGPVWLFPEVNRISGCSGAVRRTSRVMDALLPVRSRPVTAKVLSPRTSGRSGARNRRFATATFVPLTDTVACWSFTVPITRSLIVPLSVIVAAVVANGLTAGALSVTRGGVVSRFNCREPVPVRPLAVVATAVNVLSPSTSGTTA